MTSAITGFILTRRQLELSGKTYIEFWVSTVKGPVKLVTPAQQSVFFVAQTESEQVHSVLSQAQVPYSSKRLSLKTFQHHAVHALYFNKSSHFYTARDALKQSAITCYEDDIRLSERFMMERFITAGCTFTGNKVTEDSYQDCKLKAADYSPSLTVLSIDIECSEKGELFSIGLHTQDFQRVLMIGMSESGPDWISWVDDEKALLLAFIDEIKELDPDIFIGWNVVNFDFKILIERSELLGVKLTLGRDEHKLSWRPSSTDLGQGFVNINGRVIIDGIDSLKTATYHFDSFSLESVAQRLLGKGKQTQDVDDRLATIKHDFLHNKVKLANYNLQDCILVSEIFAHTKMLDFLTLRSQLTGLELDRSGGSVAAFVNLYLPRLHRAGYVSPNRPIDGGLASPGGYVMDSLPGLYNNVLVLDFKSLYPSIIRTFKIDPLGLVEGLKAPDHAIPGFKEAYFSREQHFLPDIITSLWKQRDEAKSNKDSARSQAIKILMNSFYGVLGSGGCPFYDTRLASSITMRGHEIMQQTATWIRERGYKVIYGDTDSTFVWLEGELSSEQAQQIGKRLEQEINQRWTELIKQEFDLACHLEIEFETHFSKFLMPTIRGSETGSKKRYAGLKTAGSGESLVFKGLETVRSDWTGLAKQFQTRLYEMVFAEQDVTAFIKQTISETQNGEHDQQLVYRKRLRRKLEKYVKNVPPHVKAARLADEHYAREGKPLRYQNKGWISYVITTHGPEPLDCQNHPIDYDHYIEKQIKPIAEGILPFIGKSFERISSAQMTLF